MDMCDSVTKNVSRFGTIWVHVSTLSAVNFMKSQSRSSISDEELAPKLRKAVSVKNTLNFEDLLLKKGKISH